MLVYFVALPWCVRFCHVFPHPSSFFYLLETVIHETKFWWGNDMKTQGLECKHNLWHKVYMRLFCSWSLIFTWKHYEENTSVAVVHVQSSSLEQLLLKIITFLWKYTCKPAARRGKGRPRLIQNDVMAALDERNINGREARSLAEDRNRWRSPCLTSTPARQRRMTKKKMKVYTN